MGPFPSISCRLGGVLPIYWLSDPGQAKAMRDLTHWQSEWWRAQQTLLDSLSASLAENSNPKDPRETTRAANPTQAASPEQTPLAPWMSMIDAWNSELELRIPDLGPLPRFTSCTVKDGPTTSDQTSDHTDAINDYTEACRKLVDLNTTCCQHATRVYRKQLDAMSESGQPPDARQCWKLWVDVHDAEFRAFAGSDDYAQALADAVNRFSALLKSAQTPSDT